MCREEQCKDDPRRLGRRRRAGQAARSSVRSMWRTLTVDASGRVTGEDGAPVSFADDEAVRRAALRAAERPVLETRLASGQRVALAFEPGRVLVLPLERPDTIAGDDIDVDKLARIVSHDLRAPLRA